VGAVCEPADCPETTEKAVPRHRISAVPATTQTHRMSFFMIASKILEKGRGRCRAPEADELLPLTRPASATRGPGRTRAAHSTTRATTLAALHPRCTEAAGLAGLLALQDSLLFPRLCLRLLSLLFGSSNLRASAFQLLAGFLGLCAVLAVGPLSLTHPILIHLPLLFQVANAISYLIAVLALDSVPVLLVNPEPVSVLSRGRLLCGSWECCTRDDEQ